MVRLILCGGERRSLLSVMETENMSLVKNWGGILRLGARRLGRVLAHFIRVKATFPAAMTELSRLEKSEPEGDTTVLQPDVLLPLQYYETLRRSHQLESYKLLMFAVLKDAVENYMNYLNSPTRKGQARFHEAEQWIDCEDKRRLFSFDNVCEALNINPDYMRRGLHQWKARNAASPERAEAIGS
jgi:hypothetical protein